MATTAKDDYNALARKIAKRCGFDTNRRSNHGECAFDIVNTPLMIKIWKQGPGSTKGPAIRFLVNNGRPQSMLKENVVGPWLREQLTGEGIKWEEPDSHENLDEDSVEGQLVLFPIIGNPDTDSQTKIFAEAKRQYAKLKPFFGKGNFSTFYNEHKEDITKWNLDPSNSQRVESYRQKKKTKKASKTPSDGLSPSRRKIEENLLNAEIESLLKANLNVILTGAPGTGKTYTAKKVAEALSGDEWLTDEKKWKYGRIASVQFHPGYDYSDFVVGMKPVLILKTGEELEVKDGKYVVAGTDEVIKEIKDAQVSYRWKNGVFKQFAAKARKAYDDAADKDNVPKFVFLIDEINRADLSRVFGELFSLLEEEYRYPNDKGNGITLPNGESFVLPKNLYIIGTMNDIDRSVESMDFALRRRFAWKEVKPEDTADDILANIPEKETLRAKMDAVNAMIRSDAMRLGAEYQLGGAIFAKFGKCNGDYGKLWGCHINNILSEYLRGRSNRDTLLLELKERYTEATQVQPPQQAEVVPPE